MGKQNGMGALCVIFFVSSSLLLMTGLAVATVFEVGDKKQYERLSQVPFDTLTPGDEVRIFYRESPYREKLIIRRSGTKAAPIVITGVPSNGRLPVIDGAGAVQFQKDLSDQSGRWLVKVGDNAPADYVVIRNLSLKNANNSQRYFLSGSAAIYADNAAGVFVKWGRHVTISNCEIQSCGNGVQTSYGPNVSHVCLTRCRIYNNGNFNNLASSQEHNIYLCGTDTAVQFCRFGAPHSDGNNIKDRGLNTLIRYNWIEGGKNRQLDLVDHKGYAKADAYVYGNVIIQGLRTNNPNMIHWGGDSGHSRSGTLHFFNNTMLARSRKTRFFVTRYSDCSLSLINNVFVGDGTLWNGTGSLKGISNWLSSDIVVPYGRSVGLKGLSPGFMSKYGIPYLPQAFSVLVNQGVNRVPLSVEYMPTPNGGGIRRPKIGAIDIGAYEAGKHWVKAADGKR